MVNGTVNPLQTVIKIAIILPQDSAGFSYCSARTVAGRSNDIYARRSESKKTVDSRHPLILPVNQDYQTDNGLPMWAYALKAH